MSEFYIDLSVKISAENSDEAYEAAQNIADWLMARDIEDVTLLSAAYWNIEEESGEE